MPGSLPTAGERISTLEQWVRDHEARCEERLGEIKTLVWWVIRSLLGVGFVLLCWTLAQLWTANQGRLAAVEHPPVTVVQSQRSQ